MNISMPAQLALLYKGPTQQTRVVSEAWGRDNLYCPNCESPSLRPTPPSTPVIDYSCPKCSLPFQLKSRSRPLGNSIRDAAYTAMLRAIEQNGTPNLYALHYDRSSWRVRNLILIPHFALTRSAIQPTKPTRPKTRPSDWVGCNIILTNLPPDARISLISDGIPTLPHQVRESFRRLKPLKELPPQERGWTLDVLRVVRALNKREFSNGDVYAFETHLASLHPKNFTVRDQIRKQLQVLRDRGFLIQRRRGTWELRGD